MGGIELSKRLAAVAALVEKGASVADIGTDHGYVPIFLVEQHIADSVVAMDINEGPLSRAKAHIAARGLEGRIRLRLSDGLRALEPGEADTVIAAGMGGGLMVRILEDGRQAVQKVSALILQPQSEIDKVRRYLVQNGFAIGREDMVLEDGKYYPMMRAVPGEEKPYGEHEYLYGRRLLEARHPVLLKYLRRELALKEEIAGRLSGRKESERARTRLSELERELGLIRRALLCYEASGRYR